MDHHHCWQKGATDFVTYYDGLCSLQSTYPVASIRGCAEVGVLNCQMNRIKRADWNPILTALRANRTLHTVVFHYKWEEKAQMFFNDETCRARIPLRLVNKTADVEIINDIIRAVKIFISHSQSVTSLILEGLTLTLSNIKLLSKGLKKNQSLKHLSLKGTGISDKGFIILSQVLKHCYTMEWLDLTWCNLTTASIIVIADMIRYQAIHRQSSIWKDSLRGHAPVCSSISGLKRITLNLNPQIKDSGAMKLAESLEDDVWIKALDMQSCGLTSMTAQLFVMVLQNNSTLQIADLRENELIDDNELDLLNKELANRGVAKEFNESYEWLDVELTRIKRELRTAGVPLYKKNAKSHPVMVQASSSSIKWQNTKRKGMPWRTAARSSQRWKNLISQRVSSEKPIANRRRVPRELSPVRINSASFTTNTTTTTAAATTNTCSSDSTGSSDEGRLGSTPIQVTLTLEQFQLLHEELTNCHQKLSDNHRHKEELVKRIRQLEDDNRYLTNELEMRKFEEVHKTNHQKLDDQTIQNIEATFRQFHLFLDLLNEKGYGHLTKLLMTSSPNPNDDATV